MICNFGEIGRIEKYSLSDFAFKWGLTMTILKDWGKPGLQRIIENFPEVEKIIIWNGITRCKRRRKIGARWMWAEVLLCFHCKRYLKIRCCRWCLWATGQNLHFTLETAIDNKQQIIFFICQLMSQLIAQLSAPATRNGNINKLWLVLGYLA